MTYPNAKRCTDYAAVGIVTGYNSVDGWFVEREGRRLAEWTTPDEAAMFAEELYERIKRATTTIGAVRDQ